MGRNTRMLAAGLLGLFAPMADAQIAHAVAELKGNNEYPPNGSSGYGVAAVEIDTQSRTLKVSIDFSGLVGKTTAAAIHCCIAHGSELAAATATPLAGFPLGVNRGSTDPNLEVHDTSAHSTWNPGFLAAVGTPKDAETRLADAIRSGAAYLRIRTEAFPDGEIRGPLVSAAEAFFLGGPSARVRLLGTQNLECSNRSERCVVPIYARTYGNPVRFCEARIDFREIKVPAHADSGRKVRAIWLIVNGELGDRTEYRFAPSVGVEIGPTSSQGKAFDPTKDFNAPGGDSLESRRFKWDSVHKRAGDDYVFPYNLNVERYDPNEDEWRPCKQIDPTISNR